MIRYLTNLKDVKFPVATLQKTNDLKDDATCIYYEGQAILKRKDLMTTFNINEPFLPDTYSYLYYPETLLADPKILKGKFLIDDALNVFLGVKKLVIKYEVARFEYKADQFIKTSASPALLPLRDNKVDKYPVVCRVNDSPYLVGWVNKWEKPYEICL